MGLHSTCGDGPMSRITHRILVHLPRVYTWMGVMSRITHHQSSRGRANILIALREVGIIPLIHVSVGDVLFTALAALGFQEISTANAQVQRGHVSGGVDRASFRGCPERVGSVSHPEGCGYQIGSRTLQGASFSSLSHDRGYPEREASKGFATVEPMTGGLTTRRSRQFSLLRRGAGERVPSRRWKRAGRRPRESGCHGGRPLRRICLGNLRG